MIILIIKDDDYPDGDDHDDEDGDHHDGDDQHDDDASAAGSSLMRLQVTLSPPQLCQNQESLKNQRLVSCDFPKKSWL